MLCLSDCKIEQTEQKGGCLSLQLNKVLRRDGEMSWINFHHHNLLLQNLPNSEAFFSPRTDEKAQGKATKKTPLKTRL